MRTLAEMRERVRTKLRDVDAGSQWETEEIDAALEDAYATLWTDLMETEAGDLLRTYGEAESLVADQEEYDVPADCRRILEVQVRWQSTDDWRPLPYREKIPNQVSGGTAALFGSYASGMPGDLAWTDRASSPDKVTVHPAPSAVSGQQLRFVYCAFPVFPLSAEGTFLAPDYTAAVPTDATYPWIPPLADRATEYGAIADLCDEEVDDPRQRATFATRYLETVHRIAHSAGVRFRPPRRYVAQTSRRRRW